MSISSTVMHFWGNLAHLHFLSIFALTWCVSVNILWAVIIAREMLTLGQNGCFCFFTIKVKSSQQVQINVIIDFFFIPQQMQAGPQQDTATPKSIHIVCRARGQKI